MARNGSRRTPGGWKCLEGRLWCSACTRERFVLRAMALPVSGPVDGTWAELRDALHTAFAETTRCANWLVTEFYARDAKREPGDARLRAMPRVYLYPEARVLFPALASQTLASLERQVLARYRAVRLDLVWRHAASLPTWRYPTPLPIPARMWTLERHAQTLVSIGPPRRSPMVAAAAPWTGHGTSASPARSGRRRRHRRRRGDALRDCRAS
jgi:hypothetical protein